MHIVSVDETSSQHTSLATTDKAAIYPPALAAVLPEVMHIRGKLVQQGIDADHQHPQGGARSGAALRAVRPAVRPSRGKLVQQRIERDHQHLKGRTRSMRGFQTLPCAQVICAGHGFMRNLRNGFYDLGVPRTDAELAQTS